METFAAQGRDKFVPCLAILTEPPSDEGIN